jgi:hypothetical protein
MTGTIGKVALLWRGDPEARNSLHPRNSRLEPVFAALAARNIYAEPAVYSDDWASEVRHRVDMERPIRLLILFRGIEEIGQLAFAYPGGPADGRHADGDRKTVLDVSTNTVLPRMVRLSRRPPPSIRRKHDSVPHCATRLIAEGY